MAIVNPPQNLRMPKEFAQQPDKREYFSQLEWILFQLREISTGESGSVISNESALRQFDELNYIGQQGQIKPNTNRVETSINYTVSAGDLVVCNDSCTISLPEFPDDRDRVSIYMNGNFPVTIFGDGNTINGESDALLFAQYSLLDLQFMIEDENWLVI